jgi:Methyltransferase domain
MRFDERWIGDEQLRFIAGLAASVSSLPGEVIEVGTHQGLSAISLANAIYPGTLHVVDHWLGDPDWAGNPEISPDIATRDNYGIFLDNIAEGTQGNVKVWKMDWRDFAEQWSDPVKFLYIDAAHSASEVSDNIGAFLPFAVRGAIFAGDDFFHLPVAEGVRRQFPAVNYFMGKLWWVVLQRRN